jgi:predicted XRE-type DNA-binding protein
MKREISVIRGSGNVFADLGFDNPEEELLKADLVREIRAIIRARHLTQAQAAALLGIRQPDVSALVNGRVEKFSLQRLLMFMPRLGRDVNIVVKAKPRTRAARMSLAVARQ